MNIIRCKDSKEAIYALVHEIVENLRVKKVLWLVCGGSNVPYIVETLREIRNVASEPELQNLTVGLTDEKWAPLDTVGANWKQLLKGGLDISSVHTAEVFTGNSVEETVARYTKQIEDALREETYIIAQVGIAQDGHLAGVLPHSSAVSEKGLVASYTHDLHTRVTLSLPALTKVSSIYSFVFGGAKRSVIERLEQGGVSHEEMPSQILRKIQNVHVFTDI